MFRNHPSQENSGKAQIAAYEAINDLVRTSARDTLEFVGTLLTVRAPGCWSVFVLRTAWWRARHERGRGRVVWRKVGSGGWEAGGSAGTSGRWIMRHTWCQHTCVHSIPLRLLRLQVVLNAINANLAVPLGSQQAAEKMATLQGQFCGMLQVCMERLCRSEDARAALVPYRDQVSRALAGPGWDRGEPGEVAAPVVRLDATRRHARDAKLQAPRAIVPELNV